MVYRVFSAGTERGHQWIAKEMLGTYRGRATHELDGGSENHRGPGKGRPRGDLCGFPAKGKSDHDQGSPHAGHSPLVPEGKIFLGYFSSEILSMNPQINPNDFITKTKTLTHLIIGFLIV